MPRDYENGEPVGLRQKMTRQDWKEAGEGLVFIAFFFGVLFVIGMVALFLPSGGY